MELKQYDEAFSVLHQLEKEDPENIEKTSSFLEDNYFKVRNEKPEYREKAKIYASRRRKVSAQANHHYEILAREEKQQQQN